MPGRFDPRDGNQGRNGGMDRVAIQTPFTEQVGVIGGDRHSAVDVREQRLNLAENVLEICFIGGL